MKKLLVLLVATFALSGMALAQSFPDITDTSGVSVGISVPTFVSTGPLKISGGKQSGTTVTVPSSGCVSGGACDFSFFVGSDNLLHCQLSSALGGGSCGYSYTLPAAAASTLGGVNSKDCSSGGQFIQKINTDGSETCASPGSSGAAWQTISLAVCQGSGASLAGSYIAATGPTATCIAGSTTKPQHAGATYGTAGAVGTGTAQEFQFKVPDNYVGNHAFILEFDWYDPTDTNTAHTVTWGAQYVSVTPPGLSAPTFNASANATATAISGTAGSNVTVQQTFSPASDATAVTAGDDFYLRIFLSATTATDHPVLMALRIKWL